MQWKKSTAGYILQQRSVYSDSGEVKMPNHLIIIQCVQDDEHRSQEIPEMQGTGKPGLGSGTRVAGWNTKNK